MNLKYTLERFRWIKALFSPFKPFKVSFYAGKTQVGIPFFYPRKWVKYNNDDIQKAIEEHKANKNKVLVSDAQLYNMYYNYTKPVPLKIGFSYCSLGWKTKYDDFRHEWNPVLSFVFFGYQIALTFYSPYGSHYWEPWLYYEYETDKTKSKRERIEQCMKEAPETWTSSAEGTVDYYEFILKPKYLK
jgi:hypothetical protein